MAQGMTSLELREWWGIDDAGPDEFEVFALALAHGWNAFLGVEAW